MADLATPTFELRTTSNKAEPPEGEAQVWARMLREHAVIRALLHEVERACDVAEAQAEPGLDRFRRAVWDLFIAFDDHLGMEEAHLIPILRTLDAWGEARVANMLKEHAAQRRSILELVEDTEQDAKAVQALVAEARAVAAAFRTDMAVEERRMEGAPHDAGFVPDQEDG